MQTIVGFLDKSGETVPGQHRRGSAPPGKDQLQALEMQSRLLALTGERFSQYRGACRVVEAKQEPNGQRFGIVKRDQLVEVARPGGHGGHGVSSLPESDLPEIPQTTCRTTRRVARPRRVDEVNGAA
jgi:hypothetical protein